MNDIKLTEKEVDKLYSDICDILECPKNEFKAQLKITGWIVKDETEQAMESFNFTHSYGDGIKVIELLQKRIKELEEK